MRVFIKRTYFIISAFMSLLKQEVWIIKNPRLKKPALWQRLWLYRNGFLSDRQMLYGVTRANKHLYLSDYQKILTTKINDPYHIVLNDKSVFDKIFKGTGHLPECYGRISDSVIRINGKTFNDDEFLDFLKDKEGLIIKKTTGGGGKDVHSIRHGQSACLLDGELIREDELMLYVRNLDNHMITEYIKGAKYSRTIFGKALNTVRIQMLRLEDGSILFPIAVHKFGTDLTVPADNVWKGGLTALIDMETGILGKPAQHSENNHKIKWVDRHPDTGEVIAGVKVPGWRNIIEELKKIGELHENIKYVGWDIAITDDGFRIIEGNNHTDVSILQIHQPLLNDKRVVSFYENEFKCIF